MDYDQDEYSEEFIFEDQVSSWYLKAGVVAVVAIFLVLGYYLLVNSPADIAQLEQLDPVGDTDLKPTSTISPGNNSINPK